MVSPMNSPNFRAHELKMEGWMMGGWGYVIRDLRITGEKAEGCGRARSQGRKGKDGWMGM